MRKSFKQNFGAFSLLELLIAIAIIAILSGLMVPRARAQNSYGTTVYQPNFYQTLSNWSGVTVPSNGGTVYLNPATNPLITIRQARGDSWLLSINTSNKSAGSIYVFYGVNVDGNSNNWTDTNHPIFIQQVVLSGLSNSNQVAWSNAPSLTLDNARDVFPYMASNSCTTNNVSFNFIKESHGNN